jgi:hypothetical protein
MTIKKGLLPIIGGFFIAGASIFGSIPLLNKSDELYKKSEYYDNKLKINNEKRLDNSKDLLNPETVLEYKILKNEYKNKHHSYGLIGATLFVIGGSVGFSLSLYGGIEHYKKFKLKTAKTPSLSPLEENVEEKPKDIPKEHTKYNPWIDIDKIEEVKR